MAINISARHALTSQGWQQNITIQIGDDGRISRITDNNNTSGTSVGILLPALSNVHSHSFQRAMAGLAERRGPTAQDDFWTWRKIMYRFLEILSPDDIQTIAAQVQMEMLEAGFASQAEFHYVHHAPGGEPYAQMEETSLRHFEAARSTGIGYTHLPVLYMQGGLDGRALGGGQLRFGCTIDQFEQLFSNIKSQMSAHPTDFNLGIAPHSLRAVTLDGLKAATEVAPSNPLHIHAAEQLGEVEDVKSVLGARPIRWLLDNMAIDQRWCMIHATHMDDSEVVGLARSGAVAGLCPITEANLGDGIFSAAQYIAAGGAFGIGSDSNVKIALSEELRMLEVSQRLRDKRRVVLSDGKTKSNGRFLYERAASGGAQAIGRDGGRIEIGALADMVALDHHHYSIAGLSEDTILDTWIFACDDRLVSDVWSAGRQVVKDGFHINRQKITESFTQTIRKLRQTL